MSEITLYLRLHGELPPDEELTPAFRDLPFQLRRRGQTIGRSRRQPTDVLLLRLAAWESSGEVEQQDRATQEQLLPAATLLTQLTPMLLALDRSRCVAELSISTIRHEDQGGFELPAALIAAAGAAGLSLGVSILVMLDTDLEDSDSSDS